MPRKLRIHKWGVALFKWINNRAFISQVVNFLSQATCCCCCCLCCRAGCFSFTISDKPPPRSIWNKTSRRRRSRYSNSACDVYWMYGMEWCDARWCTFRLPSSQPERIRRGQTWFMLKLHLNFSLFVAIIHKLLMPEAVRHKMILLLLLLLGLLPQKCMRKYLIHPLFVNGSIFCLIFFVFTRVLALG